MIAQVVIFFLDRGKTYSEREFRVVTFMIRSSVASR